MDGPIGLGIGIPFAEVVGAGGADCPILEALQWDEVGYVNGSSTIDVEINGQVVDDKGFTIDGTNGTYCQFSFGTSPNLASNPQVPFSYPVINNTPQSTIFSGLTPGTTYYYGLIAYNGKCVAKTPAVELVTPEIDMIVTYNTTLTQQSSFPINQNDTIRLPFAPATYTENSSYNLDITVNWGDGTTDVYNTNPVNFPADVPEHTYTTPGTYDVIITPNGRGIEGWSFTSSQTDAKQMASVKLTEIKQWGDMVFGCPPTVPIGNSGFQGSRYWYECLNLGPINAVDTPMIVNGYMRQPQINWGNRRNADLGLPIDQNVSRLNDWDMRSLITCEGLFNGCPTFNSNAADWYMPNMEKFSQVFTNTDFSGDVSKWNTDSFSNVFFMFGNCNQFNSDCSTKTVTRKAVNNSGRSGNYKEFTDTAWNMDNACNMNAMFRNATIFDNGGNGNGLNTWNIGLGTPLPGDRYNLDGMFFNTLFNGDLNNWDVSQCNQFGSMFQDNTVFNGDITNWDFSGLAPGNCAASSIIFFLRGATAFNQDISNWDLTGAGGLNGLMGPNFPPHPLPTDPTLDTSIYNDVLVNFSALGNYSRAANCSFWSSGGSNYFVFGNSQYDATLTNVVSARNQLILDLGALVDGGAAPLPPIPNKTTLMQSIDAALALDPVNASIPIPTYGLMADWDTSQVTDMERIWPQTVNGNPNQFDGDISMWDTSNVTNMKQMFLYCTAYTGTSGVGLNNWDTGNVTDMSQMFDDTDFQAPLNNWDTSEVTTMYGMFNGCANFNEDLDNWDTSKVERMNQMFDGCVVFDGDISSWDTGSVTTMVRMFYDCAAFTGGATGINNWDTSSVEFMQDMFNGCTIFNGDISTWDVSNVVYMFHMFRNTGAFNRDLNTWTTTSLEGISDMFRDATAFNGQIDNWDVSDVTQFQRMFQGATSFNQALNSWNTSTGNQFQEMFDGATSFNQNLNNWDVSNGTVARMFRDATAFNGDISTWSVGHVTQFPSMFQNATNFDIDISSWNTSSGFSMIDMFSGATSFNQDLSSWNVTGVQFCTGVFTNTTSWTDPKPNFTNCTP